MPTKPVLEVDQLEVRYGAIEAIKGISLHVDAGEIVTIIGGNGAGKSTLMKTISGLEPAAAGRVLFAGQDITQMPGHLRVSLGIAQSPEGRQVFPDQTVLDNLLLGAFHRKDGQDVIEADVHIGSNCVLIAPLTVGAGGTVGGGSTLSKDTPPGALSVARARQVSIPNWKRPKKNK